MSSHKIDMVEPWVNWMDRKPIVEVGAVSQSISKAELLNEKLTTDQESDQAN